MPFVNKPSFENYRAKLIGSGKPLPEKDVVPAQSKVVALLDGVRELLVQKAKRQGHKEEMLEITATWVGLDASQRAAIKALRAVWPGEVFPGQEDVAWIAESDEAVLMLFATSYPDQRYLTGRLLITF